jgi:hypothetical protein
VAEQKKQPKQDEEATATESAASPSSSGGVTKDRWIEEAEAYFGQPSHVVAGALADVGDEEEISKDEASAAIEEFLNKEVA